MSVFCSQCDARLVEFPWCNVHCDAFSRKRGVQSRVLRASFARASCESAWWNSCVVRTTCRVFVCSVIAASVCRPCGTWGSDGCTGPHRSVTCESPRVIFIGRLPVGVSSIRPRGWGFTERQRWWSVCAAQCEPTPITGFPQAHRLPTESRVIAGGLGLTSS